jgi:replicative DNA helicase
MAKKNKTDFMKTIPHSDEAEKAVLGSMILDENKIDNVITILNDDSFHNDRNKKVFVALKRLRDKGVSLDYINIINELEKMNELTLVTKDYLIELGNFVPSAANVQHYVNVVKEKELYRSLINHCNSLIEEAYTQEQDAYELIDLAEKSMFSLSQSRTDEEYTHVNPVILRSFERLQALSQNRKDLTGVDTGYSKLNQLTSGWQPSDLIIIAGRPSMGKTALVLNMARNAAATFEKEAKEQFGDEYKDHMKSVAFFSLEMGADQLVNRLITSESMVEGTKLRNGRLDDNDWNKLSTRVGKLAELPIYIDDSPGLRILDLRAKCRRLKSEKRAGLVIIDYLQLMDGDNKESRQQEISAISRQLKLLAKEIDVPIIALSQLSRALEARTDKRPQLSDLRESGSIEQDADIVGFVHRPEYYKIPQFEDGSPTEGMAEFIIGKQRNGPLGDVRLTFLKNFGKFADPDTVHYVEANAVSSTEDAGF